MPDKGKAPLRGEDQFSQKPDFLAHRLIFAQCFGWLANHCIGRSHQKQVIIDFFFDKKTILPKCEVIQEYVPAFS
jgi:hypothetical protein